jgi:hypothetical protein
VRRITKGKAIRLEDSSKSVSINLATFCNPSAESWACVSWETFIEREARLCLRHVPVRSKGNGIWNGEMQVQQLDPHKSEDGHLSLIK